MAKRLALLATYFANLLLCCTVVYGATSTWPAPIPLFQRSPYLNAWVDASSNVSNSPSDRWPQFFHRRDLGWFIGVRVDNVCYMIQGDDTLVNCSAGRTVSSYILPSQTRFTIAAGPVLVNLTYLAPIELQDWTLNSFPFAYAAFDMISSDGNAHAVQLYTDTTAQLLSSNDLKIITWNTSLTSKSIYHMAQQRTLQTLTERYDMSEDGTLILAYTMTPGASMTWQTCSSVDCRDNFTLHGSLDNTSDTNFRAINSSWPVLAYALDLGSITKTSNSLVFGIGLTRDPVVSYRTAETTKSMSHLWYSRWSSIGSAIDDFLTSFSSASSRANAFDNQIQTNATLLASQLNLSTPTAASLIDLHVLNLRQTVGSLEFTTLKPGKPVSMDDVRVFMKDVGYSRRTSPVEIIYASFPAFLFLNATLAGKLLEPLLEFQASSLYKNSYAAPDLGNSYPVIQGNTSDQSLLAIDSCGAMLVMALAHARKSGDGTLLFNYYDLLRTWADFLVRSAKQPGSYMSSDGLYSSNSNLAFKGIMGLYAMGKVNGILEARGADSSKTSYYSDTANSYAQDWLTQAVTPDHIMATYGANSTWAMMYNLFASRLLGSDIIPEQVYENQASWYASRNGSAGTFGLPYDSSQSLAKAHWTLFSASSVFNASISAGRDDLINMVHSRSFLMKTAITPNPATYSPVDGSLSTGAASPAMGAIYSLLALNLPDLTITLPSGTVGTSRSKSNVPVIIGAIFGALGGLLLIVAIVLFLRRYRKSAFRDVSQEPRHRGSFTVTPFTHESGPLVTNGIQEHQNAHTTSQIPRILRNEKSGVNLPPDTVHHQTASVTESVVGGSPDVSSREGGKSSGGEDVNLRREVEQLRRAVENLSAQQANQPPQVVYEHHSGMPDEPPPMYPV